MVYIASDWLSPAGIPNQQGYKLKVLLSNGKEIQTKVEKSENGMHYLLGVDEWKTVRGWKPIK